MSAPTSHCLGSWPCHWPTHLISAFGHPRTTKCHSKTQRLGRASLTEQSKNPSHFPSRAQANSCSRDPRTRWSFRRRGITIARMNQTDMRKRPWFPPTCRAPWKIHVLSLRRMQHLTVNIINLLLLSEGENNLGLVGSAAMPVVY